jgi:phage baseplate assembly protein gpV
MRNLAFGPILAAFLASTAASAQTAPAPAAPSAIEREGVQQPRKPEYSAQAGDWRVIGIVVSGKFAVCQAANVRAPGLLIEIDGNSAQAVASADLRTALPENAQSIVAVLFDGKLATMGHGVVSHGLLKMAMSATQQNLAKFGKLMGASKMLTFSATPDPSYLEQTSLSAASGDEALADLSACYEELKAKLQPAPAAPPASAPGAH